MSTINISETGLSSFIQNIAAGGASPPADQTGATSATSAVSAADPTGSGESSSQKAHRGHHHGHGQQFSKIEDAVTSALQSAQSDPSADPNKVIEDAIAKVFQGGNNPGDPPGETSTPPGATDSTNSAASQSREQFFQTLQSLGVDPAQFHKDFAAAIQDARGGNVDSSTAFQSFPPGSTVDTTA
jgi:hypothetical protein